MKSVIAYRMANIVLVAAAAYFVVTNLASGLSLLRDNGDPIGLLPPLVVLWIVGWALYGEVLGNRGK